MRFVLASLVLSVAAAAAPAQDLPAQLRMLPGWWTDRGTFMAAFDITLDEGWKTYWRAPGDTGIPPRIDWTGSANIRSATLHWPRPGIYDAYGSRTIGYADRLVLPVELTPYGADQAITVAGSIEIGVCEDVCIPMEFTFGLDVPRDGERRADIVAALEAAPDIRSPSAVGGMTCTVAPLSDGLRIEARLPRGAGFAPDAAIFEHLNGDIWISGADISTTGPGLRVTADFVPPEARPFALERSAVRLTLISPEEAIEIRGCPAG